MYTRLLAGALLVAVVGCAQPLRHQSVAEYAARASLVASSWAEQAAAPGGQLDSGTTISLTLRDTITSTRNQVGESVSAVISRDVRDREGRVAFPAGTEARVRIAAFQRPMPHRDDARVLLEVATATVGGQTYDLQAIGTTSVKAETVGRRTSGGAEKAFAVQGGTRVEFKLTRAVVLRTS